MDAGEEEDTALEIAREAGVSEDLVLMLFERKDSETECGADEFGCDEYHRFKDDGLF